jgi:hypothetical protein
MNDEGFVALESLQSALRKVEFDPPRVGIGPRLLKYVQRSEPLESSPDRLGSAELASTESLESKRLSQLLPITDGPNKIKIFKAADEVEVCAFEIPQQALGEEEIPVRHMSLVGMLTLPEFLCQASACAGLLWFIAKRR